MSERTPQDVLRELRREIETVTPEPAYKDDSRGQGWFWSGHEVMRRKALEALDKAIAAAPDTFYFPWDTHHDYPQSRADLAARGFPATLSEKPGLDAPEVVCLCGSTRFYEQFQQANYDLTMAGKIVLSVGFYPHSKAEHGHGEGVGHDSSEKVALDELHKRKIDLADRVFVLNVGGYIGQSTRGEIDYALLHDKPVDYLEPVGALVLSGSTDSEGR